MGREEKFKDGILPQPAPSFPAGAEEGTLFTSDGSVVTKGLYQLLDGIWSPVGSNEDTDPKRVTLINPRFNEDVSGWVVGGPGSPTLTHNIVTPLSGAGDAKVTTGASGIASTDLFLHDYIEADFTLENRVQQSEQLLVNFDIEYLVSQAGAVDPGLGTQNRDYLHIAILDQATSTVIASYKVFDNTILALTGKKFEAEALIDISSSSDTDLKIRILSYVEDPLAEKIFDSEYVIDNVKINSKNINKVGNT